MKQFFFLTFFLIGIYSNASAYPPWFTGPLLAPAGKTIPKGHTNVEPYIVYTDNFGVYNNHWKVTKVPSVQTYNINPVLSAGVADRVDIQTQTPLDFNTKEQKKGRGMTDFTVTLGYQVVKQENNKYLPSLRLSLNETLPTGRYNNLDPSKLGTDSTGAGSLQTAVGLNFEHLTKPLADHYLRSRLILSYNQPGSVKLSGFNSYGGGIGTLGNIKPGRQFQADFSMEYQLTQNWVPVMEINYLHRNRSTFSGNPGLTRQGAPATVGNNDLELLSLAPAIEYNFNAQLGIIIGSWFSLEGKGTSDFKTVMFALNYYS
jgi:hypothetical protein